MKVKYLWDSASKYDNDLVCELTEFMDRYLEYTPKTYIKTYLYNDLNVYGKDNNRYYIVAFRYPGATRGGIYLKRIGKDLFEITDIKFNEDVSFGKFSCYKKELKEDVKEFIGRTLDFSEVHLLNNILED